jgi:hypothetical protein
MVWIYSPRQAVLSGLFWRLERLWSAPQPAPQQRTPAHQRQTVALLSLFGFATYLRSALAREDNGNDWLGRLAAGAGQTFVGLTLAGFAIGSIARLRAGPNLDLSATMALFDIHVALYVASWAFGAMFMAAAAGLGLRSRALPLWLSLAAAIVALVNLAAVALPTSPIASFPNLLIWLWVVAASAVLCVGIRRTARPIRG